jgi:hypothetical protein
LRGGGAVQDSTPPLVAGEWSSATILFPERFYMVVKVYRGGSTHATLLEVSRKEPPLDLEEMRAKALFEFSKKMNRKNPRRRK